MSKRPLPERVRRVLDRRRSGAAGVMGDRRLRRQRSRQEQRRAALKEE